MQKTKVQGSILIWATFLSLIITVSFISVNTKINKNLNENKSLLNIYKTNNELKNILNSGSISGILQDTKLTNGDIIIFEKNPYLLSLKKNETKRIKSLTDGNSIDISINGSPVQYIGTSSSGIIIQIKTINAGSGEFISFTNLGGKTNISINNTNIRKQYTAYVVKRQIGNKEVIKTKGKIQNF